MARYFAVQNRRAAKTTADDPLRLIFFSTACGYWTDDWDKTKKRVIGSDSHGELAEPICPTCGTAGMQMTYAEWLRTDQLAEVDFGIPYYAILSEARKEMCFDGHFENGVEGTELNSPYLKACHYWAGLVAPHIAALSEEAKVPFIKAVDIIFFRAQLKLPSWEFISFAMNPTATGAKYELYYSGAPIGTIERIEDATSIQFVTASRTE